MYTVQYSCEHGCLKSRLQAFTTFYVRPVVGGGRGGSRRLIIECNHTSGKGGVTVWAPGHCPSVCCGWCCLVYHHPLKYIDRPIMIIKTATVFLNKSVRSENSVKGLFTGSKFFLWPSQSNQTLLKGTASRDFLPLSFCLKDSTWASYDRAKTVSRTFSFSQRYFIAKFEKSRVRIVNDYTDRQIFAETKKFRETIFACSYGAKMDFLKPKKVSLSS